MSWSYEWYVPIDLFFLFDVPSDESIFKACNPHRQVVLLIIYPNITSVRRNAVSRTRLQHPAYSSGLSAVYIFIRISSDDSVWADAKLGVRPFCILPSTCCAISTSVPPMQLRTRHGTLFWMFMFSGFWHSFIFAILVFTDLRYSVQHHYSVFFHNPYSLHVIYFSFYKVLLNVCLNSRVRRSSRQVPKTGRGWNHHIPATWLSRENYFTLCIPKI